MPEGAIYQRQNRIRGLVIPKIASVVGCGGTGFWTAVFLAMSGVEELILVDSDAIELSNLNRLPVGEDLDGVKKTAAATEFICNLRKLVRIETHDKRIETAEDCTILRGTVFCCTDNLKSQQIICAYCKKNDFEYQRIGYDGTILNVSKAFPLSFEEATNQGGYTVTPSWVIPAAVAAGLGVFSKLCRELCVMDDLAKLSIVQSSYIPEGIKDELREEGETEVLDNIHEHIPDDYGYCGDCDCVDPSNGDYGYCPDCERVDPCNDEYGYCPDCDRPTSDDVDKAKEEAQEEGYEDGFDDALTGLTSSTIKDDRLKQVADEWMENRISEIRKGKASNELVFRLTNAIQDWEKAQKRQHSGQLITSKEDGKEVQK